MRSWLLIEVHGSWGRDAVADSQLGPHAPPIWRRAMKARGIRVIAIRRDLDRHHAHPSPGLRLVHVVAGRPGAPFVAHRRIVDDLHHVVAATESVAATGVPDAGWNLDTDRYVLVCTNGRHDACCATQGRPLVRHLRTTAWDESVWECSHIGGDRFAGNVVLLPDSLYFGRCEPSDVERLLAAHDEGRLELSRLRGRSTLTLVEQAAEHFARTELGLDALDAIVAVTTSAPGEVHLGLADGRAVDVVVGHTVVPAPTPLTCKGAGGLGYPVFHLAGLHVVD